MLLFVSRLRTTVFGMTSSRFAQSYCSSAPVRLRYICFAGIGHSNSRRHRKERAGTLFQDLSGSRLLGHSVFVTPDLQLASPTHAPVHATLAKVIHGSEFAVMTIVRIDAIVAKNPLNLQNFSGRLLMCLGHCTTCGCLFGELDSAQLAEFQRSPINAPWPMRKTCGEHDSAQRGSIVPGILSEPQRGIYGSFT